MLSVAASPITTILVVAGLAGIIGVAFFTLRWSLNEVRAALERPRLRLGLAVLSVSLVALYLIGLTSGPLRTMRWFSVPVTWTYWDQANFTLDASSDLLRNADDPRTQGVFHPSVRGKTDRFLLRLRK